MSKTLRNYAISMMFLRGVTRQWKIAMADRTTPWPNRCGECAKPLMCPLKHRFCMDCWNDIQDDLESEFYDIQYPSKFPPHSHPCHRGCKKKHDHSYGVPCDDPECMPCPGCGGRYDGYDHGGLGCSRRCAYGGYWRERF